MIYTNLPTLGSVSCISKVRGHSSRVCVRTARLRSFNNNTRLFPRMPDENVDFKATYSGAQYSTGVRKHYRFLIWFDVEFSTKVTEETLMTIIKSHSSAVSWLIHHDAPCQLGPRMAYSDGNESLVIVLPVFILDI